MKMTEIKLNEKKMEHMCILLVVTQTLLRLLVIIMTFIFVVHCWYNVKTCIKIADTIIFVMLCIGCIFISVIFNRYTDNYMNKWGEGYEREDIERGNNKRSTNCSG